jgi:hypothetical protein
MVAGFALGFSDGFLFSVDKVGRVLSTWVAQQDAISCRIGSRNPVGQICRLFKFTIHEGNLMTLGEYGKERCEIAGQIDAGITKISPLWDYERTQSLKKIKKDILNGSACCEEEMEKECREIAGQIDAEIKKEEEAPCTHHKDLMDFLEGIRNYLHERRVSHGIKAGFP